MSDRSRALIQSLRASTWAGVSLSALLAASPALSQALPTGGEVAAGSAVIGAASPTSLTVTQSSARAILNWKSFSVGDGASVRPAATCRALTAGSRPRARSISSTRPA